MHVDSLHAPTPVHGQDNRRPSWAWRCRPKQQVCSLPIVRITFELILKVHSRSNQIWDPTLGAFRAQRLPIALSKSSIAANALNGTATKAQLPRPSIPSYTSLPRSFDASATNYTYSSAQSLPPSLISQPSSSTIQTEPRAKGTSRAASRLLPPEVYDCILQQLRILHEAPEARSCQTCLLRDLCSLSLTSRAWDKAAQKRM